MPYLERRHRIRNRIEVEQYFAGMYGNHEERLPKWKMTSKMVEEINRRRSAKGLRRTIDLNFEAGDLYLTFTYRRGVRCGPNEAKEKLDRFMRRLKYQYTKRGIPFKWIKTTGLTSSGKPHHHVIINKVAEIDYAKIIEKYFPYGEVNFKYLYSAGSYKQLADYFVKHKVENEEVDIKVGVLGYSCSRNLKRSNPKAREIKERKIRRLPKIPRGYQLTECEEGVTQDGYLFRYYTLEKLKNKKSGG